MYVLQVRSSLEEHFGSCGEISRMSIPKDYESGSVKGYVFLLYHIQIISSSSLQNRLIGMIFIVLVCIRAYECDKYLEEYILLLYVVG